MSRSDMLTLACIGFSPLLASQGRDIAYAPRTVGHGWKTVLLIADLQADPGQQGFTVQAPKPIYCILCIVYCVLCIVYCVLYIVYCILYIVLYCVYIYVHK